ncbi:hypothetical protein [Sphingomonas sp. BK069]|uniref:hypothetical protein n=1 Tax=Sphingomonas sp. BK069 TaxID=2586979 RepID=UPI00161F5771|nr:hypothetical protein [Sphingomonas sp. BK069]MBB3349657.1 hypothetical protein [Sphingomonas sp. BK069]
MMVFGGANSQSPAFYNLVVAAAVLLFLRSINAPDKVKSHGIVALLLSRPPSRSSTELFSKWPFSASLSLRSHDAP